MALNKDRKIDVAMSEETLARAEQMCSGLSLSVSIEKRGAGTIHPAMLDDLNAMGQRARPVRVVHTPDQAWLTIVSQQPLSDCSQALLVYRSADGASCKLLGRHASSRPGTREGDPPELFVTPFTVVREIDA